MKNLKIFTVITTLILACLPVGILYFQFWSDSSVNNGFNRKFSFIVKIDSVINLHYPGYYFSGHNDQSIFLGHTGAPAHIKEISFLDKGIKEYNLDIPINSFNNLQWQALVTQVKFPYVYFASGPNGLIFRRPLNEKTQFKDSRIQFDSFSFDRFNVLNDSLFFVRHYNDSLRQNVISEIRTNNTKKTIFIPSKQVDGIFCTDGILLNNSNKIVYLFYYRNQFQVIDINDSIQKRGRTIDTNSVAKINLKYFKDSLQLTLAEPPLRVNKTGYLSDQYLFINSVIKADNELVSVFREHSVIDQYDLNDGHYIQSFYLPKYLNERSNHFIYSDEKFIGIYKDKLVIMSIKSL